MKLMKSKEEYKNNYYNSGQYLSSYLFFNIAMFQRLNSVSIFR
jgi:hypothetical protein